MNRIIEIKAPASKSLSHRAIIASALAEGESTLRGVLDCDDTEITKGIFEKCGVKIKNNPDGSLEIQSPGPKILRKDLAGARDIFVGESGTSCRILASILANGHGSFFFHGAGRMHERPMKELTDILSRLSCTVLFHEKEGFLPLTLEARGLRQANKSEDIFVSSHESSQFISGLLMSAPLSDEGLSLALDLDSTVSRPYILLTLEVMEYFGISFTTELFKNGHGEEVDWRNIFSNPIAQPFDLSEKLEKKAGKDDGNGTRHDDENSINNDIEAGNTLSKAKNKNYVRIRVEAGKYKAQKYEVEGDYSGASYLIAAGALASGGLKIKGLKKDSLQGDAAILDILNKMGGIYEWDERDLVIRSSRLRGAVLDMGDCPDLVPTVAVMALKADSPTRIVNTAHLKAKESDRIKAPAEELRKLGAHIEVFSDGLEIYPLKDFKSEGKIALSAHNDHRIAMSLALLELFTDFDFSLDNPACVSKSYPDFWKDWQKINPQSTLGGK